MVTVKGENEGKSGFLKEFFVDHPGAGKAAIDGAWREAGNEGTISGSLISKIRKDLGLTGKGRSKAEPKASGDGKARKGSSAAPKADARQAGTASTNGRQVTESTGRTAETRRKGDGRTPVLLRLEAQIDEMIHEIKLTGGLPGFEEALRKARRILARSHEE